MAKQLNVEMNFTANTSQAKQQLQQLKTTLDQITTGKSLNFKNNSLNKSLQESVDVAIRLKSALQEATNASTGKLDLTSFTRQMNSMGLQVKDVKKHLLNLGPEGTQAFIQMARSIQQADGPLVRINNKLGSMLTTLKNTAKWQISSSLLHGFISTVSGAYRYAQDLNESLNNIRIRTGQSTEEMAKFAEQANQAAKALGTTTTAYTNAALIYYQQGLDDKAVKERTDITVKMANVTKDSAETVSQQLTAVWNNFDKGGQKLEYIADVMNALGAATASSTSEIATGLQKFAAAADAAGLSYEYAASALATITAVTRQSAETVGTGLRTVLARIESLKLGETLEDGVGLTKYTEALEKIGVHALEANGQLRDADEILYDMAQQWQNLTKAQKMATAETVGGIRQYTTIMALMENWDFFQRNVDVANQSEGTLQEQADIYAESWEAASKRVKAAAQAIYSDLINDDFFIKILNGAEKILTFIDDLIGSLGGLPGLLSTISTLLFNIFGDKIANSMTTMIQSLAMFTEKGRQQMDAWKNSFAAAGSNASIDTFTYRGDAQSAQFDGQIKMQQAMQENAVRLSEEEQKILALRQEQISKSFDLAEQYGIEADKQKEITAELEKQILNNTKSEEYTMQKERLRGFNASVKEEEQQAAVRGEKIDNLYNEETTVEQLRENLKILLKDFGATEKEANKLFKAIDSGGGDSSKAIKGVDNQLKHVPESAKKAAEQIALMYNELQGKDGSKKIDTKKLKDNKEALKAASNEIPEKERAKYIQEMKGAMTGSTGTVDQFAASVDAAAQAEERYANQLEFANSQVTNFVNAVRNAKPFENWATGLVTVAQGISMMSMSINTVIGSIGTLTEGIANGNLTFSQFLSTIGAMGMSFTMIWPQLTKLADSFTRTTQSIMINTVAMQSKTAAQGKNLVATLLNIAADKDLDKAGKKSLITMALEEAGIESKTAAHWAEYAIIKLKEIALKKYMIIALAAVAVVVGLIALFTKMHEAELKAHKDQAEVSKERTESLKEEADANQELINSYNETLDAYNKANASKTEMDEVARKLAATYGIENAAILIQQGRYEDLAEAVDKARIAELKRLKAAQETAQNDAESVFADSMHSFDKRYNNNVSNGQLNTHILTGGTNLTQVIAQARDQLGLGDIIDFDEDNIFGSDLIARAENTKKGFQEIYEAYSQMRDKIAELADNQGLDYASDFAYTGLNKWLQDHKEAYEAYMEITEKLQNANLDLTFAEVNPENLDQFNAAYEQAQKELEKTGVSAEKAKELLDTFLAGSDNQVLVDFYQVKSVIDEVNDGLSRVSDTEKEAIQAFIKDGHDNADVLSTMNLKLITTAKEFEEAYKQGEKLGSAMRQVAYSSEQIEKVNEAISKVKDNMSLEDYSELQAALSWGENGIIEFSEFLQKTAEEQKEYLNHLLYLDYSRAINGIINQMDEMQARAQEADAWLKDLNSKNDFDRKEYEHAIELEQQWKVAAEARVQVLNSGVDFNKLATQIDMANNQNYQVSSQANQEYITNMLNMLPAKEDGTPLLELSDFVGLDQEKIKNKLAEAFSGLTAEDLQLQGMDLSSLLGLSDEEFDQAKADSMGHLAELAAEYLGYEEASTEAIQAQLEQLEQQKEIYEEMQHGLEAQEAGLDVDEWDDLTEHLQDVADESEILADSLEDDRKAAENVSKSLMRMNKGVDKLADGFSDWNDVLRNSAKDSQEYSEAVDDLRDAASDLLSINEDFLSRDFLTDPENLDLFARAAQGDADAIDQLRQSALEDIILNMDLRDDALEGEELWNRVQALQSMLDDMGPLEVGSSIDLNGLDADEANFITKLNELILAAGMTTEQVNAMLAGMGFTANYASEPQEIVNSYPDVTTTHHVIRKTGTTSVARGKDTDEYESFDEYTWSETTPGGEVEGLFDAFAFQTSEPGTTVVPKINSITKNATGGMNNRSSRNPGGGSKGKGGGGGGGGSAKTNYAKHQKSEPKEVERYKEINDELSDLKRALDKASDASDRLWGQDRLKSMEEERDLIQQQADALQRKKKEAEDYYKKDKKALNDYLKTSWAGYRENENGPETAITSSLAKLGLGNLAFEYDADGSITNWESIYGAIYKKYNEMQAYWANPANWQGPNGGDAQEQYENEVLKPFEEWIQGLEKADKQYQDTTELIKDLNEELADNLNTWQDLNFEELTYKLELKLQINENDLKRIEYYMDKLDGDFYQMGENLANYSAKIQNTEDALEIYKGHLVDITTAYTTLDEQYKAGEISEKDYYEQLQKIHDESYDYLQTLTELNKTMEEYFENTLDAATDELEKYTGRLDHINDSLEHYQELMKLMGRQSDYKMIGAFLQGIANNNMNRYLVSKTYYDELVGKRGVLESQLQAADLTDEARKTIEKELLALNIKIEEAEDTMLENAQATAETMQEIWQNTVDEISHNFEMLATDGLGFDFLNDSLDRLQSRQDEYLTKTNQLYEMNDLLRKLQSDSDKTNNVAAKQRIANFSNEMKQLRDKNELSKLDLDIAKARYQQLLAEIALEEAQNTKSMVRLHRDNEGNYGYMYTTDQDKVGAAEDALLKANNDLYNIVLEGTNKYGQMSLDLAEEYIEKRVALEQWARENHLEETEEYQRKLYELEQEYRDLRLAAATEFNTAYTWLDNPEVSTLGAEEAWVTKQEDAIRAAQDPYIYADASKKLVDSTQDFFNNIGPLLEGINSLATSLGTPEELLGTLTDYSNNLTESITGEHGLVEAIGKELQEVLDGTNKYLREQQAELLNTQTAWENINKELAKAIVLQSGITGESISNEVLQGIIDATKFDTGGYTGRWGGSGKLAVLHEKELILNQEDTENLLLSIDILRRLTNALDLQAMSSGVASISSSAAINMDGNALQQDVTIHAEFPNVVNHNEIEMAFDTLINRASQYAGRF